MKAFPSHGYKYRNDKTWDDRDKEWKPYSVEEKVEHGGMDLRDYFAAKAMQAYCVDPNCGWSNEHLEAAAYSAYRAADAMLKVRNER